MTELQVALGIEQLKAVDSFFISIRRELASIYFQEINTPYVVLPQHSTFSSWNLFIVLTSFRIL